MKTKRFATGVIVLCLAAIGLSASGAQHPGKRKITDAEVKAVIQAVEDEIYDHGYQGDYADVDVPPSCGGHRTTAICLRIYINSEINGDGSGGEVIYKLMPHGEVFREFGILQNGLAVLDGDPANGFPPTEEYARKTVYMDEDRVFRMKRDWLKRFFQVDASADMQTLDAAGRRQKQRTGDSHWEAAQSSKKRPK